MQRVGHDSDDNSAVRANQSIVEAVLAGRIDAEAMGRRGSEHIAIPFVLHQTAPRCKRVWLAATECRKRPLLVARRTPPTQLQ
ncbi:hypothetical protein BH23DEI1_BH23DEI1_24460 [soil metagenome]